MSTPYGRHVPQAHLFQLEEALGGRTALKGTPEELREQYAGLLGMLAPLYPPPTDAVSTKDGDVDGIGYRIYTPVEAAKGGALPVGLYTHGGGFVLGDLNGEDVLCRAIAEHCACILVSVDYRLAPDHKAPAQLQDSLNVLKWVCASYFGERTRADIDTGPTKRLFLRRRPQEILHHRR